MHETHGHCRTRIEPRSCPATRRRPADPSAPRRLPRHRADRGRFGRRRPEPRPRGPSWAEHGPCRKASAAESPTPHAEGEAPSRSARKKLLLPWDLRIKIAVVVSFGILVTVLILNRNRGKSPTTPLANLPNGAKGVTTSDAPPAPAGTGTKSSSPHPEEESPPRGDDPPLPPADAETALPRPSRTRRLGPERTSAPTMEDGTDPGVRARPRPA